MNITFHGAAGGVTGSKHIIEHEGKKILLECGMHQGHWRESYEQNKELPFDVSTIDAVVLSHAHIDHSGLLPVLAKQGYRGPIHTTQATAELLRPLLMDAAHIQAEDAAFWKARALEDPTITALDPLYSAEDAETCLSLMVTHPRQEEFTVADIAQVTFTNAGHILGSSQVHLKIGKDQEQRSIGFTGDLGPSNRKIIHDPVPVPPCTIMISESTYGGRIHKPQSTTRDELAKIVSDTYSRKGKVIIPSFALERTQEILYDLHRLYNLGKIPRMAVFVDSPLATNFTEIFSEHLDDFDEETHEFFIDKNKNPFAFKGLVHTADTRESKKLNRYDKPCIIIAGSGMCEAGRVKHHLAHHISDKRNTILFVGYQAEHTLGRKILEGENPVRIFGRSVTVRANIFKISGYSAHADQKQLVENLEKTPGIEKIFLVHGDGSQATDLKEHIAKEHASKKWEVIIPEPQQKFEL